MRILRVALGALIAAVIAFLVWFTGVLQPPEGLRRRVVAFVAIYPGPVSEALVDRVICPPLRGRHLYVVCTEDCEGQWRLLGVTGLRVETLRNFNRVPPEDESEVWSRLNRFIAREELEIDTASAPSMIGCHMRVAGLYPELIVTESDVREIEEARPSEEKMRRIAEGLRDPPPEAMTIRREGRDLAAGFLYWDTSRAGRPILEVTYRLSRDGRLLDVRARERLSRDDTAFGNTPDIPPS